MPKLKPQIEFEAIGTRWFIELEAEPSEVLRAAIKIRIDDFDQVYSRFRRDSVVTAMAKRVGAYELPDDASPMFELYADLYRRTDGRMTPLIGQTLDDAGYDADYSLEPGPLVTPPSWDETIDYVAPVLHLKRPALLDFGALGKGHLVDLIGEVIEGHGITTYLVNAGGDMRYRGDEPLAIELEDPARPDRSIGRIELQPGMSLCGSSGNRRAWGAFTHIIDPTTLRSPSAILGLWVIAESTILADALTTALIFITPEECMPPYQFDYAIITADKQLRRSAGFVIS